MNESRPGVTSAVLNPQQAIGYLNEMLVKRPDITVLGIAGPGDPFANPEETLTTLQLARAAHPKLLFCLASNGLDIAPYIDELADLKVSHVSITVNTFDPRTGGKIYAWVRDHKTRAPLQGLRGAGLLIEHQREAIRKLKEKNIIVKINTIIIPGVNDVQVPGLAKELGEMGVDIMNCMPMLPIKGALFQSLPEPDTAMMTRARLQAGEHVKQMTHCARCRADAVGLIHETPDQSQSDLLREYSQKGIEKRVKPFIAVATASGATVDQPLGEAPRFLLFSPDPKSWIGFSFQELRIAPQLDNGTDHWKALAETLFDCHTILVSAAGPGPRVILEQRGIKIAEWKGGPVEDGLKALFAGQPLPEVPDCSSAGCSTSGCGGGQGRRNGGCFN